METPEYNKILKYLQSDEVPHQLRTKQQRKKFRNFCKVFVEIEGKLFKKNQFGLDRQVIQKENVEALLYLYHDDPVAGHLGANKMYRKLTRNYYWPKMFQEVQHYAQTCDKCQRFKGKPSLTTETIEPTGPWERVGIDFIG